MRLINTMFLCFLTVGCSDGESDQGGARNRTSDAEIVAALERARAGEALWENLCRTEAGENIYEVIEDVEGILLIGALEYGSVDAESDPLRVDAAFAKEAKGADFIASFLGYEQSGNRSGDRSVPVSLSRRGYINLEYNPDNPSNVPGYDYVDVMSKDGARVERYVPSLEIVGVKDLSAKGVRMALERDPDLDLNVYRWKVVRADPVVVHPRYAIKIHNQVNLDLRTYGVAKGRVEVIDLANNRLVAELTRFAWSLPKSRLNPNPWAAAYVCPGTKGRSGTAVRHFVDRVLIPSARSEINVK